MTETVDQPVEQGDVDRREPCICESYARTTERARYFRVSIACGRNGYVPSALGAKSRIQSLVAATNRMPSLAHPSDAVRSEKRIWGTAVGLRARRADVG